jgi:hypothetical protein
MAAFQGIAQTAEVALVGATVKTVVQIVAPSNHRAKVLRWGVFFDGVSVSNEPVQVELLRQTTAGTMSALTPVKVDNSLAETLQVTAQHTATVEPTPGDILDVVEIHPQSGWEIILPLGQEFIVGGGDRIGIRCTAPDAVNARAKIVFEE